MQTSVSYQFLVLYPYAVNAVATLQKKKSKNKNVINIDKNLVYTDKS